MFTLYVELTDKTESKTVEVTVQDFNIELFTASVEVTADAKTVEYRGVDCINFCVSQFSAIKIVCFSDSFLILRSI